MVSEGAVAYDNTLLQVESFATDTQTALDSLLQGRKISTAVHERLTAVNNNVIAHAQLCRTLGLQSVAEGLREPSTTGLPPATQPPLTPLPEETDTDLEE